MEAVSSSTECYSFALEREEEESSTTKTSGISSFLFGIVDFFIPVNPLTQKREFRIIPQRLESFLGRIMYPAMIFSQGGRAHPYYLSTVQPILSRLIPHTKRKDLPYEVTVINKDVVNAWCLPGGKIGVYKLLLERIDYYIQYKDAMGLKGYTHPETGAFVSYRGLKAEDVIAALLGHEMTHADARHTAQKLEWSLFIQLFIFGIQAYFRSRINSHKEDLAKQTTLKSEERKRRQKQIEIAQKLHNTVFHYFIKFGLQLYFLFGSRCHEYEADKYGAQLSQRAGYNPAGALFLQEILKRESYGLYDYLPSLFQKVAGLWHSYPSSEDRQKALYLSYWK